MPEPDVVQHLAFDVAANAGGDDPVDQLAIAGLHQLVGSEFRELAALPLARVANTFLSNSSST